MIEISVSAINARAPYSVTLSSANSFQFITHSNVYYTVGFVLDPTFIPDGVYQFYIVNDSHHNYNADPLVKETITVVIEEFFKSAPTVMLYICDPSDNHQGARDRLFRLWFNHYSRKEEFSLINGKVTLDGIDYFSSIMLQKNHPEYQFMVDTFCTFIDELPAKLDELQSRE